MTSVKESETPFTISSTSTPSAALPLNFASKTPLFSMTCAMAESANRSGMLLPTALILSFTVLLLSVIIQALTYPREPDTCHLPLEDDRQTWSACVQDIDLASHRRSDPI